MPHRWKRPSHLTATTAGKSLRIWDNGQAPYICEVALVLGKQPAFQPDRRGSYEGIRYQQAVAQPVAPEKADRASRHAFCNGFNAKPVQKRVEGPEFCLVLATHHQFHLGDDADAELGGRREALQDIRGFGSHASGVNQDVGVHNNPFSHLRDATRSDGHIGPSRSCPPYRLGQSTFRRTAHPTAAWRCCPPSSSATAVDASGMPQSQLLAAAPQGSVQKCFVRWRLCPLPWSPRRNDPSDPSSDGCSPSTIIRIAQYLQPPAGRYASTRKSAMRSARSSAEPWVQMRVSRRSGEPCHVNSSRRQAQLPSVGRSDMRTCVEARSPPLAP